MKSKAQSSRRPARLPRTPTWKLMAELKRMPEKFKRLSARLKRLSEHKRINIELSIETSIAIPTQATKSRHSGAARISVFALALAPVLRRESRAFRLRKNSRLCLPEGAGGFIP